MGWNPIATVFSVMKGPKSPFYFGPWVHLRAADNRVLARWSVDHPAPAQGGSRWVDPDGRAIAFAPDEWRSCADQEIADITDLIALIIDLIDDPPSTPAQVQLAGLRLEGGLQGLGRSADPGALIAGHPGDLHTMVALKAFGRRLYRLGLGLKRGPKVLDEVLAALAAQSARVDSGGLALVRAAWADIATAPKSGGLGASQPRSAEADL